MKLKLKLYNFKTAQEKINLSKVNSHNKVIYGIINTLISYTGNAEMQNEEINSGTITTVINAILALYLTYLTIHTVILQFPQQLVN